MRPPFRRAFGAPPSPTRGEEEASEIFLLPPSVGEAVPPLSPSQPTIILQSSGWLSGGTEGGLRLRVKNSLQSISS